MHSDSTSNGLHLEAWGIRHPGAVSSMEQAQEVGITEGQWRCETTLWNDRAKIGSVTGGVVMGCWNTTTPRGLCGSNTSEYTLLVIKL